MLSPPKAAAAPPWQYKWKNPTVHSTKVESTNSYHGHDHAMVEEKVRDMLPIDSVAAQISYQELQLLFKTPKSTRDEDMEPEGAMPKWEDLESSDEEDSQQTLNYIIDGVSKDDDITLTVTILASSTKGIEGRETRKNMKRSIPADTVLIEITSLTGDASSPSAAISLPSTMLEESKGEDNNSEKHILTKLLNWPTTSMDDTYGLTNVALCRHKNAKAIGAQSVKEVDVEDAIDLLERATFGIEFEDHYLKLKDGTKTMKASDLDEEEKRGVRDIDAANDVSHLLLSCLTNDGKVHIFSALTLLALDPDSIQRYQMTEANEQSPIDILEHEFASFLLGHDLHTILKESIVPLSQPLATIELSLVKGTTNRSRNFISSAVKEKEYQMSGKKPFIDMSFLDANIDHSTAKYRTIQNIPTTCVASEDHIIIAGAGILGETSEIGGFVTLISLDYFSEVRNIFLPFIPRICAPITWESMNLVVLAGEDVNQCVALRTDSYTSHGSNFPDSNSNIKKPTKQQAKHNGFVKKYSPFPLTLSLEQEDDSDQLIPLGISSMTTSPPSMLCYYRRASSIYLSLHTFESLSGTASKVSKAACISLRDGYNNEVTNHCDIWSICGQGWSLVGVDSDEARDTFFVLWDGASSQGAYTSLIESIERDDRACTSKTLALEILPCKVKEDCGIEKQNKLLLLNCAPKQHDKVADGIILCAIDDVGRMNERDMNATTISNTLLWQCPSWLQLDDTFENRTVTNKQIRIGMLRFGPDSTKKKLSISLRKNVIRNGGTSDFEEIIPWLCRNNDYDLAAAIGLHLLEDYESRLSSINANKLSTRDRLLDGVSLLKTQRKVPSTSVNPTKTIDDQLISLSDMILSSLVKDGNADTIEKFVTTNDHYNTSRACLILCSTFLKAIFDVNKKGGTKLDYDSHATLWPLQCLLRLAVTRSYIEPALLLLNATIPNEMRNRGNKEELCKAIIKMILSSTGKAAHVLLSLVDRRSQETYWDSLEHQTRLALCLMPVRGKYPFLREREVRDWAMEQLNSAIKSSIEDEIGFDEESVFISSEWLREICTGVLNNAGCEVSLNDEHDDSTENDVTYPHDKPRLLVSAKMGGIDFDLIIPALLLLENRSMSWNNMSSSVSTQHLLNIICDEAGKHTSEELWFAFDHTQIMKQCALSNNILAASYLLGGHDGLILKCINALMKYGNVDMAEAERFLISGDGNISTSKTTGNLSEPFVLTEGHKDILTSLQQHVLSVSKYGQFEILHTRGRLDPVFAATICLRAWLFLMKTRYPSSGAWLESWFRAEGVIPTKRLACAALVRALLWSNDSAGYDSLHMNSTVTVLADHLEFSAPFLIDLSRAGCGLIESIHPSLATEIIKSFEI